MPWDPDRYRQFQSERSAPFEDLLRLIKIREGLRVVDLGCGTGELTRRLADALPSSEVLGIDSSPQMLERAQAQVRPGLRFEKAAIEEVVGQWDLVFSHSAIQWVEDHEHLMPRLLEHVAPGGQLAVQQPSNYAYRTHALLWEVAAEEPLRSALGGWVLRTSVLSLERYAELLYEHGGQDLTVLEKIYPHVLKDADALADWARGTALVPYFERLSTGLQEEFLTRYRARLRAACPGSPVFCPFKRMLLSASKT
jgi:trans-aconitate 2-methyltransferase